MEYIWYGAYPFDKNLFEERLSERYEPFKNLEDVRRQFTIYNKGYLKPKCISALWGSPNAVSNKNKDYYTWKEWCKDNNFKRNSDENLLEYYQKFKIKRDAKILKINSFYNELLLMMDKPLSLKSQIISVDVVKRKVREVPKSETSKQKTVISSVEKPVLQTKTAKKNYASDPDILALHTMNRKIQGLKDMYYKMDSKSQEAKKLKIVIC